MTISSAIPNISYNEVANLTAPKKPQAVVQNKQDNSASSTRKGIIPGISGEFPPPVYPAMMEFSLGSKIDVLG